MAKNQNGFTVWDSDYEKQLFTPEEIEENALQAKLIGELISARESQGMTQRDLEKVSGVTQSAIARLEKGVSSPTLDTVFKILIPLGKTLTIVPMNQQNQA